MEEENFKYYAFISYSHRDKKTAQRLHKRLRSYHLPSKLIQSHPELPKKLGSVFLDEANLVAKEGSLTESLQGYLRDSKFLILICSPDSAKSPYVNDEVEYFMKLGRRKHIIPLIVSGLPHSKDPNAECFVPAILNLSRELEPLGIDLKTYGERDSFLRIIATTLGLDLEYFISIEARERKRKAVIFSSVAAVLVIAVGTLVWHNFDFLRIMYDAEAQYNLGAMYYYGRGVEQDYNKAIEWYEKAAVNGNAAAQVSLGYMYDKGLGVAQDYDKAIEWYAKAAANGNTVAEASLIYMYDKNSGTKQIYDKAIKWHETATADGYIDSRSNFAQWCYELGENYFNGNGVERDFDKAIEWYEKAAANGNSKARNKLVLQCERIGHIYLDGKEVKQDYDKAKDWFEKAAASGSASAQFMLGLIYNSGWGVECDYDKAQEWYEKAATNDSTRAREMLYYLAEDYKDGGRRVKKDYAKAMELYQLSANQGYASAQAQLGIEYYFGGDGVKQDYAKAAEWYEKAANNGNSFAQKELAKMYEKGLGVEKDPLKAQEWYSKAAGKDNK